MRVDHKQPTPDELRVRVRAAEGTAVERRQQIRTLVVLALLALLFSIVRTGAARGFTTGWLRLW